MTVDYHYLKIALSTTLLLKINKSAKTNKREREKEIVHILNDYFKINKELPKCQAKYASLEYKYQELKKQCSVLEGKRNVKSADGEKLRLINIGLRESVAAEMEKIAISRGTTDGTEISFACQTYISEKKMHDIKIRQMVQEMHEEEEKLGLFVFVGELTKKIEALQKEVRELKEED